MTDALLIIESLVKLGYRIWVERGNIRLSFRGQIKPDKSEVKRLTNLLKQQKAKALAYLAPFAGNAETPAAAPGSEIPPCRLCPAFWPAWKSEGFDGWCLYHRDGVDQDTPVCQQFREARVTEDTLEYPYCPREPRQCPNSERNDRLEDYPEEDSSIHVREPQKVEVGH